MGVTAAERKRWSNVVFATLFALSIGLFGRVVWPFAMPVLLGAFLAVLFAPVQNFLEQHLGPRRSLAAALSTAAVVLLICVPVVVIGYLVAQEVLGLADQARALLAHADAEAWLAAHLPAGLAKRIHFRGELAAADESALAALSSGVEVVTRLLEAGTELAVDLFLMAVAMYYFFLDGPRLFREGGRLVPLDPRYLAAFAKEFRDVTHAILYGNTLTAVVQGAVGFVGLVMAKVPHPLVWGVAMALVALIPVGGTALVWGPIGIALLLGGHLNEGVFLLAYGALIVSTVDNVVRPWVCGSRMALHPLLVFLSMFGGLAVFGMMGLLVGPLIAALFMSMVRIYRRDFLEQVCESVAERLPGPARAEKVAPLAHPPVPQNV